MKLTNNNIVDAIRLYQWNMALSQELYLPLQTLEVCLRNTVAEAIDRCFGQNWYSQPRFETILSPWAKNTIKDAVKEKSQVKQQQLSTGDIIAHLTFGFWREMLKQRYEKHIWKKQLRIVFPHLPSHKNRQDIYDNVDAIIKLRNRIFHHEPILNKKLRRIYDSMLETIGWSCVDTKDWVEHYSNFEQVFTKPP